MRLIRILKKYNYILDRRQRRKLALIFAMMIIEGFLEMLSVSLVFPFMEAVMDADGYMQMDLVRRICGMIGINSGKAFLSLLAVLLAVLYVLKNVYLIFQGRTQSKFVYDCMLVTQKKLLKSYLLRPYEFFLGVNSGEVLRIIGNDTSDTYDILLTILSLLAELVVSAFLFLTLLVVSPVLTLCMVVVLFLMSVTMLKFIRPVLGRAGKESQNSRASMNSWILQSIQGIKEIKISRCEIFFEDNFVKSGSIYVRTLYNNKMWTMIPRYMIEALSMSAIFIIVAWLILKGVRIESIIPFLSGIAIAAVRLLPSVNRMVSNLVATAFYEPMIDKTIDTVQGIGEIENVFDRRDSGKIQFYHNIVGNGISYMYPNSEKKIFDGADFQINKGESVGIIGESGGGKTTLVDIVLGLLLPQEGNIWVDGVNIDMGKNNISWLENIGYVPQQIFMLDLDIRHNIAFGIPENEINDEKIWDALREASLCEFVKGLPNGLETELGERGIRLSGGQRQRIGIARALYFNPSILVFDEATSALDSQNESAIMESINNLHGTKTMIIIAHRLTTIEQCDRVFRVRNGKIEVVR